MNKKIEESIASSLDADLDTLPYLSDLLVDLWSLGSALDIIVDLVRSIKLTSSAHVLDLGCGKGATAITIAARLELLVTGIDANTDFLKIANQKAAEFKVPERCQFILDDIFHYINHPREFDVVIFASLGGLLGDYQQTVGRLRQMVRSGGYIIIDDGYLKEPEPVHRKGYEHYFSHQKCIEQLTSYGDIIVREVSTVEESKRINEEYLAIIIKRGNQIIQNRPDLEQPILQYVETQKIECDVMEKYINGAAWMLKKIK